MAAGSSNPLDGLSTRELAQAFRQRRLSPVEITQALLAHIEAWEPHLHATWALDADAALAMARESETRYRRGAVLSALDMISAKEHA